MFEICFENFDENVRFVISSHLILDSFILSKIYDSKKSESTILFKWGLA
jgi:hypothetical protein